MDQSPFYKHLIDRYINNQATVQELEVLDALVREGKIEDVLMVHMKDTWDMEEAAFLAEQPKRLKLWPRIAAAAAILLVLSAGLVFYLNKDTDISRNIVKNDLAPGSNKAVLTFADGRLVNLSDAKAGVVVNAAELKYNDGTAIAAENPEDLTSSKQLLSVSTPRGGTYQVVLPDGTKVWLNATSVLKFPAQFASAGERKVELTGEAYFEVSKDKAHPFVVHTSKQAVEVLGTHFNISSYLDETETKTTLLEGSVKVASLQKTASTVLKPGQQATLQSGNITVNEVDTDEMVAWKNGYFKFVDEDMQSIMRQIARWYDVDIQYEGKIPDEVFSGRISKYKNISQVLRMIEAANSVHFKVEGRRVTVIG